MRSSAIIFCPFISGGSFASRNITLCRFGHSCSVDLPATLSDEREDLSGEVTLQGSNGVEFGMPFGYPTSNIVLGSLVGP